MELGVDSYVTKSIDPLELKQALLSLYNKGFYFEKNLSHIINEFSGTALPVNRQLNVTLTERKKEIISSPRKNTAVKRSATS